MVGRRNERVSMRGLPSNRVKPYAFLLFLVFVAALYGVIVLHKQRELRILSAMASKYSSLQKKKIGTDEMKTMNKELETNLRRGSMEMESSIDKRLPGTRDVTANSTQDDKSFSRNETQNERELDIIGNISRQKEYIVNSKLVYASIGRSESRGIGRISSGTLPRKQNIVYGKEAKVKGRSNMHPKKASGHAPKFLNGRSRKHFLIRSNGKPWQILARN